MMCLTEHDGTTARGRADRRPPVLGAFVAMAAARVDANIQSTSKRTREGTMQNEQSAMQGSALIGSSGTTAGRVPGLEGWSGRVRFDVGSAPFAMLDVRDGGVKAIAEQTPVDAVIRCKTEADALRLLRGEVAPVVWALQGRLEELEGNLGLAARLLFGLQAASPFRTVSA
jgi:hypothetical protein